MSGVYILHEIELSFSLVQKQIRKLKYIELKSITEKMQLQRTLKKYKLLPRHPHLKDYTANHHSVFSCCWADCPVQHPHPEMLPSESTTQLVRDYPEQSHEQILQGSHSIKLAVIQGCI